MANITPTSICNEALVFLGEAPLLTFPEESTNGDHCEIFYDRAKESELVKYPWNFATKRQQLTRLSSTPVFDYSFEFQIPPDLLKILEVYPKEARWRRESNSILADCDTLYIVGIYNVNEDKFNAQFASVISARLAILLAPILTERDVKFTQAGAWYEDVVGDAKRVDSHESSIEQMDDLDVVRSRRSGAYLDHRKYTI